MSSQLKKDNASLDDFSPSLAEFKTRPSQSIPRGVPRTPTINSQGRRESYRDQDSCLHYFISTSHSEKILDDYISQVIHNFLNEPAPIHASLPFVKKMQFNDTQMPLDSSNAEQMEDYLSHLKTNLIDTATRTGAAQMIGHMVVKAHLDDCFTLFSSAIGSTYDCFESKCSQGGNGLYVYRFGTTNDWHVT